MTITGVQTVLPGRFAINSTEKRVEKAPPKIYSVSDFPFKGYQAPQRDGFEQSQAHPDTSAIVIDNEPAPRLSPVMSRYRERKLARQCQFVGYDAYVDATTRGQMKPAFDPGSSIVGNWDVMEGVLDYVFIKMGINSTSDSVERPIIMTEPIANMGYPRKMMNEILFECYNAPSVAYGVDSLFAYRYNKGTDGLIVSSSNTSTHVIPVLDSKPLLSNCSRLNWGGFNNAEYLAKQLKLKYPTFPARLLDHQIEDLVRNHCYVSQDYDRELSGYLDWTGLEDRDHVIQYPFTEHVVVEKSEEELAKIAERKKESGRRLQEQAAKMRLEKLVKKEQELEYWKQVQERLSSETKKEVRRILETEDLKDENHLERMIRDLEKSIKRSRNRDLGIEEEEQPQEEMTFPLVDVPDEELDEAGIKEKRHQRLMKSNVEARARAKAEKEREKARREEEERLDREKRENDFENWIAERRMNRQAILQKIKDQQRMKADLGNRKSLASQQRMKTLANLASDGPKKRRRGGDDDDFGANDDDWGVYRTVAKDEQSDDEEEEDLGGMLNNLEQELLQYDPEFTENHTLAAQSDWTKSLVHAFLRGPWPFDPESQREAHQLHLNVERIRVPEVVFKPSIAGVDQAGLVEIAADIVNQRFSSEDRTRLLKDVFLTGGNTLFTGFDERLRNELRGYIPIDAELRVRRAADPTLDAWKGAAQWASNADFARSSVSRQEYLEKGSEYMKEHDLGNVTW
ncbi:Actin-like protein arp5 [Penicillium argentinense]|uniref:Actin-like protein arp5 n=1 Tax=Penicillium argentinense TaxID=1131581 RepID=A0A9W9KLB5_9EURO|nr:Actin-like protein arp5 [Penicillium argentinense]KAJ5110505.1 Actin-like protein arp5 [Penicillium argentinense]